MDMEYLLTLQGLRESLPDSVESAFLGVSELGSVFGLVICAIIYWCIDKRAGLFSLLCFSVANFINQLVKNVFCVYRPWVLDSRIKPSSGALPGATGYSFPSGHTVTATTVFGSIAVSMGKRSRAVWPLCAVIILLVAFSRNYLGVHTPQDVVVGFIEAVVVVFLGWKVFGWLEQHQDKDGVVVLIVLALCVAALAFVTLKPYPMDYVEGAVLVDPEAMKKDCFEGVGVFAGAFLGWFCERRWANFSTGAEVKLGERFARCIIGIVVAFGLFFGVDALAKMVFDPNWAKLVSRCVLVYAAVFLVPLAFGLLAKFSKKEQ